MTAASLPDRARADRAAPRRRCRVVSRASRWYDAAREGTRAGRVVVGCTPIYDAQLDDRATQLEALRTEFLPGSAQVQFIMGSETKLYWVDL